MAKLKASMMTDKIFDIKLLHDSEKQRRKNV